MMIQKKQDDNTTAASEIIAVVILIAIFAVAVGIVGVVMLSNPPGDAAPAMLAHVDEENGSTYLYHDGGDPLERGRFAVIVDGIDRTGEATLYSPLGDESSDWTTWGTGQALVLPGVSSTSRIMIVAAGVGQSGSEWLLYENGTAGTPTPTIVVPVNRSFINFVIDENVFVYGNVLSFSGNTVTGPGATVVITGGLVTSDLNGGTSISVSEIYIDGDVTLDGGSAGLGSATEPGNIYVNGDLTLGSGSRNIYGDTYVAGNFFLKDARIHGNVYVDGDLTLNWTPWLVDDARIYYTGKIEHPNYYDEEILKKCVHQATVPGVDIPDQGIAPTKPAEWYAERGYVSGGALTDGIRIYADSYDAPGYSPPTWSSTANNIVIIARSGDITLKNMGDRRVTGVFYAPNGKVTFEGTSLEGVVIARDGFFVTSGGTTVVFRNIEEYISNPDDYPF
ncbi:type IV pilin [Methanofollis tationis]|uniref:Type IV pilin n=1 Tax=Methanofollis tationis TaxID=81417 RepID=A0A7K4HL78_9EURY|nr:type IV pilin [Methanofollis tationis]NVO65949.1 type IV pilin [Methanofollis tationis]